MKLLMLAALLANTFTYGYIPSNTTLYSDYECTNAITTLPKTYFCIVIDSYEETGVYKVSYMDLTGYVKNIEIVDYEPVTKFATATFTVSNDGYPAKLRNEPTEKSEVLVEVPSGKSGFYYGDAWGSALIEQVGNKWHYVSFTIGTDVYNGYVYSAQVTVSEITDNVIEKVEIPVDKGEEPNSSLPEMDFLLIALLTVPSVLIMFIVFKDKERKPRYKE